MIHFCQESVINLKYLTENVATVVKKCSEKGIKIAGVMKGTTGIPQCSKCFEDGGASLIASSRLEQLEDAKVQELLNSTQASYDEKLASDEALSKYLSELGVEGSAAMEAAEGAQITVKSNCNIRKEPSQDAESIGKLVGGQTVTKTGEDGDWIKIEFEGQTGYVRGDMFQ